MDETAAWISVTDFASEVESNYQAHSTRGYFRHRSWRAPVDNHLRLPAKWTAVLLRKIKEFLLNQQVGSSILHRAGSAKQVFVDCCRASLSMQWTLTAHVPNARQGQSNQPKQKKGKGKNETPQRRLGFRTSLFS